MGILKSQKSTKQVNTPSNSKTPNTRKSPSGIVLNIFISLLAAIVLFMSYSIYLKLKSNDPGEVTDKAIASEIIQLEVLNGCGKSGIAETFTEFLRTRNMDVVNRGNYRSFEIENSFVIDRSGNIANAEKVADILGINRKNIVQQLNDEYLLDVSLVIGKDFNNLKPLK